MDSALVLAPRHRLWLATPAARAPARAPALRIHERGGSPFRASRHRIRHLKRAFTLRRAGRGGGGGRGGKSKVSSGTSGSRPLDRRGAGGEADVPGGIGGLGVGDSGRRSSVSRLGAHRRGGLTLLDVVWGRHGASKVAPFRFRACPAPLMHRVGSFGATSILGSSDGRRGGETSGGVKRGRGLVVGAARAELSGDGRHSRSRRRTRFLNAS